MGITESIAGLGERLIGSTGYVGLFLLMGAESMVLPLPSEAILPFAGFLLSEGAFTLWGIILVSTLGSLVGSLLSYGIGHFGSRSFVVRYGRYLLFNSGDLDLPASPQTAPIQGRLSNALQCVPCRRVPQGLRI